MNGQSIEGKYLFLAVYKDQYQFLYNKSEHVDGKLAGVYKKRRKRKILFVT